MIIKVKQLLKGVHSFAKSKDLALKSGLEVKSSKGYSSRKTPNSKAKYLGLEQTILEIKSFDSKPIPDNKSKNWQYFIVLKAYLILRIIPAKLFKVIKNVTKSSPR